MLKRTRIIAFLLSVLLALPLIPAPITANAADGDVIYINGEQTQNTEDGKTPETAYTSFANARTKIPAGNVTIVVCGPVVLDAHFSIPTKSGTMTITSKYGNIDYRQTANASITFINYNVGMHRPLVLENIDIISSSVTHFETVDGDQVEVIDNKYPYPAIKTYGYELTIGNGVNCSQIKECGTFVSIVSGDHTVSTQTITINSGDWQRVRGTDYTGTAETHNTVNLTVNGGTFHEKLILAGEKANYYTNVTATINGGEFLGGIYLAAFEKDGTFQPNPSFTGDVSITLNGGNIYGPLSWSFKHLGTFSGTYNVTLNGGGLHHITEIYGPDTNSTLTYGNNVDPAAIIMGEESFTTCLREGADPYVFYHDGMYYFVSTGSTFIGLACAANISDLGKAAKTTIFTTNSYKNAWSPEIHHFTDEEIGAGNGGWYMFLGLSNTDATDHSGQREYVLKCLDGDYLLGRWGNPLTGEVNEPLMIEFTYSNEQGTNYNDIFCAGMSILRLDGKVYMTFVSELNRGTSEFHQTINIVEFETPWNITGEPVAICRPDYDWEKNGYAYSSKEDKWYPQVVEGCSPVYGDDGSVYLVYTGSGYWTTWYALGYMKYTGTDPLDPASWTKNPTPILQRKETLTATSVNGSGHGSYFTDADGNMWVCYHGYIGKNTSSGRSAFLERIYVSESGVSIGGEGINPPDYGHTQTANYNYLPLEARASGFTSINKGEEVPRITGASLTLTNSIAVNFMVKNANSSKYTNVYMVFEANGKTEERYPEDCRVIDGLTAFSFYNLTPAMMTTSVKATLYATYGGTEYVLDTLNYSVTDYCYDLLADGGYSELHPLIVDMLNYGAEAKKYTDPEYVAAALPNAGLTDDQKALATDDAALENHIALTDSIAEATASWTTAGLELGSVVAVKVGFTASRNASIKVVIKKGEEVIRTFTEAELVRISGGYSLSYDGLAPWELSEALTVTVYDGDTAISNTLTYSAESYAFAMQNDASVGALVKAMMRYGKSVANAKSAE